MEQHLLSLSSSHHFWNPLLSNEGIKKRFARAMFAFRAFPGPSRRWPSSHRALALISITPPFVLIEYLLAYLLLITEAAAAAPSHRCTQLARPLLNAQLNPRRSLPPAICGWAGRWVCKCQSLAARTLGSQSIGYSFCAVDRRRVNQKINQRLNPSVNQPLIPSCQSCDCRAIAELETGDEHGFRRAGCGCF